MTEKNTNGIRSSTARGATQIRRITGPFTLSAKRRCRNCGSNVPPGLKFCTHCGQPLTVHGG